MLHNNAFDLSVPKTKVFKKQKETSFLRTNE